MCAARYTDTNASQIVEHLLQKGAALDVKDNEGLTALIHAISKGSQRTLELLLDYGADLEDRDPLSDTALIIAAGYSDSQTVEFLLDRGADIEAHDQFGLTPLMKAGKCGTADTVNLLLDRGAKIDAIDNEKKEALNHVATRNRGDIIKILTSRGADCRKLSMLNWAAENLSGSMYWPLETCRKWEREWETAEKKKLNGSLDKKVADRVDSGKTTATVTKNSSGDISTDDTLEKTETRLNGEDT